jgi:hypothetical protein
MAAAKTLSGSLVREELDVGQMAEARRVDGFDVQARALLWIEKSWVAWVHF